MARNAVPRWLLFALTAAAVILPMAICLLVGTSALLGGLNDAAGSIVLAWIALGVGVVWALALIGLLLVLAIQRLAESEWPAERPEDQDEDMVS